YLASGRATVVVFRVPIVALLTIVDVPVTAAVNDDTGAASAVTVAVPITIANINIAVAVAVAVAVAITIAVANVDVTVTVTVSAYFRVIRARQSERQSGGERQQTGDGLHPVIIFPGSVCPPTSSRVTASWGQAIIGIK